MKTRRPAVITLVTILMILTSLLNGVITLVKIHEGDPGLAILVTVSVIGDVFTLIAAAGVFAVKQWGLRLAVVLSVFGIFSLIIGVVLWDALLQGLSLQQQRMEQP